MKQSRIGILPAGVLAGTVLLGTTLSVTRYRREIRIIRKQLDSHASQILESDCGRIEYARVGTGYPVLVIHGNAGGFDQGLGLAKGYLDPSFQVIAPSRFGYLGSPLPENATPATQADAYVCLLDSLGLEHVAIFATSAGVTSAVQFALRYPERVSALVFVSPNGPGKEGLVPPPESAFKLMVGSDYIWWALTTYFKSSMHSFVGVPKGLSLTSENKAEILAAMSGVLPITERSDGMVFDTYFSNPEINKYPLGEIHKPTLVVSAEDDPMALHANARALSAQIPNSRLVAIPNGGHLLLGHTEEVRSEITLFLNTQVLQNQVSK